LAPYNIWKQLEESLVLSKSDYNDVVCNPVPDYLLKRLQRMQLAVAGSVLRYCIIKLILGLSTVFSCYIYYQLRILVVEGTV
jgi:hypothetical protein